MKLVFGLLCDQLHSRITSRVWAAICVARKSSRATWTVEKASEMPAYKPAQTRPKAPIATTVSARVKPAHLKLDRQNCLEPNFITGGLSLLTLVSWVHLRRPDRLFLPDTSNFLANGAGRAFGAGRPTAQERVVPRADTQCRISGHSALRRARALRLPL